MQVKSIAECLKEHSAILLTCIKRFLSVLKTYFQSSFEWPLKTGFSVFHFSGNIGKKHNR